MFAYCLNSPSNSSDPAGNIPQGSDGLFEAMTLDGGGGAGVGLIIGAVVGLSIVQQNQSKKPANLPSKKKVRLDMDHIVSGHMPNGPRNPKGNKDVFYGLTAQQVMKAVYEAYSTSSKLKTQGHNIKLIGYSQSFNLMIEMWVDTIELIIKTAYPK